MDGWLVGFDLAESFDKIGPSGFIGTSPSGCIGIGPNGWILIGPNNFIGLVLAV